MSVAEQVKSRIENWEAGKVITFDDFADLRAFQTVALNLSRLQKAGVIERLSKGRYYKLKQSKFAKLKPSESEILTSVLRMNGGYVAGASALNRFGISTQVPSEITIAGSRSNRRLKIANLRLRFVKGPESIEGREIESSIADIIEVLKRIKKIPPSDLSRVVAKTESAIGSLKPNQADQLVGMALQSRPFVRAVLGALLEKAFQSPMFVQKLRDSLNPITVYKLRLPTGILPNARTWRIQ